MKTNFFEELKSFMLSEHKEDKDFLQYVRYYETLFQKQDVLKPLLDDLKNWRLDIHFEEDETGGYTYGKYSLYLWNYEEEPLEEDEERYCYDQERPDYYYEIELTRDERYWGYCECNSDMEGYNHKYKCCGNGCDWVAPSFTLKRVEENRAVFSGLERDIWKLEETWNEHLDSYNEKKKKERLDYIEQQLTRLQKEKEELIK